MFHMWTGSLHKSINQRDWWRQIHGKIDWIKIQLVNAILDNMGANQLFEPEGDESLPSGVLEAAYFRSSRQLIKIRWWNKIMMY